MNDRYFASVLGPRFPNRSYLLAATSFGHLTTSDIFPPGGGYKPITGTIFDLLETTTACLRLRRGGDLRARRTAFLRDMRRPPQSPLSLPPGAGAECSKNLRSATDTSVNGAAALCPDSAADPTGPFPAHCASFDQLGVRVPFLAISPFSKQY